MTVGALEVVPQTYWTTPVSEEDLSRVLVGGCAEDAPCPGFVVLEGDAVAADAAEPVLDDGIACPGGEGLTPTEATVVEEADVTVAHGQARLTVFDVTCVGDVASEAVSVQQRQWVADGPDGTVVVVDRWGLDGLDRALAESAWTNAT